MHASQLSVSLLQFTNPFGILTILAFSLFVNNSEKIELWVPLMGPLLRYLGPLLVPFLLKVGSPLGPLFRIFGSPFDCVTVLWPKGAMKELQKNVISSLGIGIGDRC